ncbi:MAG: hypothetical protein H7A45_21335 [Verrucomicrobiales bacterium]|nr:hypothetical protein [Verrucomicrobiales bacterium]MCP5527826.1 hypothetical protein [Verrucomicrobiales bacterium]
MNHPTHPAAIDVLGLGCTAVDELLFVPRYPGRDARQPLQDRTRQCGGITATALVAAARLGVHAAYAGALGSDEDSRFVRDALEREEVDLAHLVIRPRARPVHSYVIVEEETHTRTILYDVTGADGADPRRPARPVIESARVLLVDRWGMAGMLRAARIARAAGRAVVGDLETFDVPGFEELLALADHLIVPEAFVRKYCRSKSLADGLRELWRSDRQVVIVTRGSQGCLVLEAADATPRRVPAFAVPVMDTTGCGDVFHGAYAAALARGLALAERVEVASAAAALKATRPGGQSGIPRWAELRRFLRGKPARADHG